MRKKKPINAIPKFVVPGLVMDFVKSYQETMEEISGVPNVAAKQSVYELLSQACGLQGEVYRGEIIARGHKIEPVISEDEIQWKSLGEIVVWKQKRWRLKCQCGYQSRIFDLEHDFQHYVNGMFYLREHIDMTKLEPATYARFAMEWFEDMPEMTLSRFLRFLIREKGILIHDFDTRSYTLVDDDMSDTAIAELKEFLAGEEVNFIEMRVLKP